MFRRYINLFLTLLMPVSILAIIVAILSFTFKFEFSEAIKLGILSGITAGVGLSVLLALIVMVKRRLEEVVTYNDQENKAPISAERQETLLNKQDNTFILFMDTTLAFEASIYSITKNLIGEIVVTDEKRRIIDKSWIP